MGYKEGTIAATANPSKALYDELALMLTDQHYELVETLTISGRTHKVWKSPAAWNALAKDWYLDVAYTETGATPVYLMPFEQWDAVGKLAIRAPFSTNSSVTLDSTTGSRFGATGYSLESSNWWTHNSRAYIAGQISGCQMATTTSAFAFYLSVTPNRVVTHSSADSATGYAGLLTPSEDLSAIPSPYTPFPLYTNRWISAGATPSADASGGFGAGLTRTAPATGAVLMWQVTARTLYSTVIPARSVEVLPPRLQPVAVCTDSATNSPTQQSLNYGNLDGVYFALVEPTVQRGDRVTVGSDEYVILRGTGVAGWLVKAS